MTIVGEVKCYHCSRVCAEVDGELGQPLDPHRLRLVGGGHPCAPRWGRPLRCQRCGGPAYLDEVHPAAEQELLLLRRLPQAFPPAIGGVQER